MGVSADFSYRKANNFVVRLKSELIELVANVRFQLPEEALVNSVRVSVGGQELRQGDENGFSFISPDIIELDRALRADNVMQTTYMKA